MSARVVVVCALLLGAATAYGADSRARARALYDRGMAHYNVGEYDAAIGEFKQAYELTRAPGLLFNLAQACRLAKHNDDALHFYRGYLRERPDAPNKKDVKAFIAELERAPAPAPAPPPVAESPPPPAAEPPPVETAPVAAAPAPVVVAPPPPALHLAVAPPAPRPPRRAPLIAASAVLGGVGLAALGTGAFFAASASDASNSIAGATAWNNDLQRKWDDGHTDAQAATALFVVGGVVTGVAVILAAVAGRKAPRRFALAGAACCAF